jgi:CheY-like chemotaxis protein
VVAYRILVVNDDQRMADSLATLLAEQGYELRCAPDGQVGLDVLAEWPADLVVLDLYMPRLDGWTFLRKVGDHQPLAGGRPITVVWSVAAPEELEDARRLGAEACLFVPNTSPDVLLETVARLLVTHKAS